MAKTRITFRGEDLIVNFDLPDNKTLAFVSPTGGFDALGNPTALSGTVVVTTTSPNIQLTMPDPTTPTVANSGTITVIGPGPTATVHFEDDGDGPPLSLDLNLTIISGPTATLAAPTLSLR